MNVSPSPPSLTSSISSELNPEIILLGFVLNTDLTYFQIKLDILMQRQI